MGAYSFVRIFIATFATHMISSFLNVDQSAGLLSGTGALAEAKMQKLSVHACCLLFLMAAQPLLLDAALLGFEVIGELSHQAHCACNLRLCCIEPLPRSTHWRVPLEHSGRVGTVTCWGA